MFAKEAYIYFLFTILFTILLYIVLPYLSLAGILLLLFFAYFFRNPKREIKIDENKILSPADGKIMNISTFEDTKFINGKAVKITIFLSPFNVHINRTPCSGIVKYHEYFKGQFLPAFKAHCSELNERNTLGILCNNGEKIMINQITGILARRIVWDCNLEDKLIQGQRFGMIKFGSCTELILPADKIELLCQEGDIIKANLSCLAIWRSINHVQVK